MKRLCTEGYAHCVSQDVARPVVLDMASSSAPQFSCVAPESRLLYYDVNEWLDIGGENHLPAGIRYLVYRKTI